MQRHRNQAFTRFLNKIERTIPAGKAIHAIVDSCANQKHVTDDWSGYNHHAISECGNPEVGGEFMPIIPLVFNNMKNWLNGIHHGVSPKHLQAYLNEFTFRFKRRFYPFNALRSLLGIAGGREPPTYPELHSGEWKHPTCSGALH